MFCSMRGSSSNRLSIVPILLVISPTLFCVQPGYHA
jgi:hypothetical protein